MTIPDVADVLNRFAERMAEVLSPKPAPLNRAQRRAQGKPRQGRRERELQSSLRLVGKGRTRRPAKRR